MPNSKIAGIGYFVPDHVVTNDDMTKYMDTTDEWIQERTGIKERRFADKHKESTTSMAAKAATIAIERAGIEKEDIDFIVFATLSPDYFFPGCGVLLQRELGISKTEIGALDIRNQCSGFIYGLSVADQFIKTGMYKNILLVGSEKHSMGLDFTTEGRGVAVIFGDGAGAVVLQPTEEEGKGVLTTKLHSDGTKAEELALISPGAHGGYYHEDKAAFGFDENDESFGGIFVTDEMVKNKWHTPYMNGQAVFKKAVQKFPEVILEALNEVDLKSTDIDLLVPHQANLRISQFVQRMAGLSDEQVYNNIQKYGNTTAASIPIALCEAWENGKVKDDDLIVLAAFGSGFTWGSALIRW
jgi:3-oxoacyl-[acyl-carrier-protein] synthase-3